MEAARTTFNERLKDALMARSMAERGDRTAKTEGDISAPTHTGGGGARLTFKERLARARESTGGEEKAAATQMAVAGPKGGSRNRPPRCRPKVNPAVAFRLLHSQGPLAGALGQLQTASRAARGMNVGANTVEQRKRVTAMLAAMTTTQQSRAMASVAVTRRMSEPRTSAISQFCLLMEQKRIPWAPVTKDKVSAYLAWFVYDKENMSHNLKQVLSSLKTAATTMGVWKVDTAGLMALGQEIIIHQLAMPSESKAAYPVPTPALVATAARLGAGKTLRDKRDCALIVVSVGTLARGTEVGGEGGMMWGDMATEGPAGLGFNARYTKLGKKTSAPRPRACPHFPSALAALCPHRALVSYKSALQAAGGGTEAWDPVWVPLDKKGELMEGKLTVKDAMDAIRMELGKDGVDPKLLTAHWARHTGNSVLAHDMQLEHIADDLGDWAPPKAGQTKATRKRRYSHMRVGDLRDMAQSEAMLIHGQLCCGGGEESGRTKRRKTTR